ncbi:hypothetical protein C8J98_104238 [Luteibacter sp. OK325]|uniref:hypothetical protein n=1 Tax=Luteibacter sp. OK325 TaxID=2135670 RepID=UPI000D3C6A2C|nr:hypothetical protein [Luteibacter sp. OK325]PTR33027.1 hypothetical protein C8J98_104238 [Luteibacter sp. OK325]
MGLTFDQKVQLWNTIGTWFAGVAGAGAIITSLYLATRVSRVSLRTHVTLGALVSQGRPLEDLVEISVTNLGERTVTITGVGWRVGKGAGARNAVQNFSAHMSDSLPIELPHGKQAGYRISMQEATDWPAYFRTEFIRDAKLSTLRAVVSTSVGQEFEIKPRQNVLDFIAKG